MILKPTHLASRRSLNSLRVAVGDTVRQRQISVEGWPGNPQHRTDLVNAEAAVLVQTLGGHDARIVGADRPATAQTAPCPGCGQTGLGTLLDQAPLELRQAREDVEHEFPGCRSGVDDAVLEGPEADPLAQQILHQAHQVWHRAPEPVQSPDDQGIPRLQRGDARIQPWTAAAHSRRLVPKDASVITPRLFQGVELQLQILPASAHASVADQPSHAGLPSPFHLRSVQTSW